jgi:hypothetical protein
MLKAYKYLFYRLYTWLSRSQWETNPEIPSFLLFTAVTWANCLLLVEMLEVFAGRRFVGPLSEAQALATAALVALPIYFFLFRRERYKGIIREFSGESQTQRHIRGWFVLGYMVAVWVLVGVFAMFRPA